MIPQWEPAAHKERYAVERGKKPVPDTDPNSVVEIDKGCVAQLKCACQSVATLGRMCAGGCSGRSVTTCAAAAEHA